MERWEIRAAPSADDPKRHLLLIRGGMSDVAALLKKFGAVCGRPATRRAEDYNLSLVLHQVTPALRARLEAWLSLQAPPPEPEAEPASSPPEAVIPVLKPPEPEPAPAPESAPEPEPAPVPPAPEPTPVPPAPEPPPAAPIPVAADRALGEEVPPPHAVGSAADRAITPGSVTEPYGEEMPLPNPLESGPPPHAIVQRPVPVPAQPPAPMIPAFPTEPSGEEVPPPHAVSQRPTETRMATPAPAASAASPPSTPPPSVPPPPSAPLTDPLRADWNFESLLVGAHNRFAHAAATSVVSSPGTMYNPLFLYGLPGTGKSHLLHSMAGAFSRGLSDSLILLSSGARLSRAVSTALARGSLAEVKKKCSDAKVLFVDDIHLMAITEQNREALADLFQGFFERKRQVVITSLYPPRTLGALEEALKFSFSKGWSVDLKLPGPNVQKDLVASACDRAGAQFNNDEIMQLHEKLAQWGYQDLGLWVNRLAVLRQKRETAGQPASLMDLLLLTYEPVVAGGADVDPAAVKSRFAPPAISPISDPIAVIAPRSRDGLGSFAASLFYEVGGRNAFGEAYRHALWETYDDQQQVGVPFQIADLCHKAGVTRALIVGPTPESALGPRSAEFGHAARHILESVGVRAGWIPFNGMQIAAHYLNAHLDFHRPV